VDRGAKEHISQGTKSIFDMIICRTRDMKTVLRDPELLRCEAVDLNFE